MQKKAVEWNVGKLVHEVVVRRAAELDTTPSSLVKKWNVQQQTFSGTKEGAMSAATMSKIINGFGCNPAVFFMRHPAVSGDLASQDRVLSRLEKILGAGGMGRLFDILERADELGLVEPVLRGLESGLSAARTR